MAKKQVYTKEELSGMTLDALRQICFELNIKGMSKKRKDIVIENIMSAFKPSKSIEKKELPPTDPNVVDGVECGISTLVSKRPSGTYLQSKVKVYCGPSSGDFDVSGKSLSTVMDVLREVLSIPSGTLKILVNGVEKNLSYILKDGDVVEFIKPAGKKG